MVVMMMMMVSVPGVRSLGAVQGADLITAIKHRQLWLHFISSLLCIITIIDLHSYR